MGRPIQADPVGARQGFGADRRSGRSLEPADCRQPSAEEFGGRAARQCRHRSHQFDRAGGGLGRRGEGRRQPQAGARQQGPCHRPEGQSAQGRGFRHSRQAAFRAQHQSRWKSRAGRQSRRQVDQRALHQGNGCQAGRYGSDGRQRLARRLHARWEARFGHEVPGTQGVHPRCRGRQGHRHQDRPADRVVALQRRCCARRKDRAHVGQRQQRRLRR